MSHTTTIGQILFADQAALQAAAEELRDRGIRCELIENAVPRAYSVNQEGMGEAPLVLRLDDSRYDVGFYPSQDNPDALEARTDLYQGHVARQIGSQTEEGVTREMAAIGKLRNSYATHATMNAAARQGATVTRQNNDDGSVQLVIRNAA